MTQPADEFHAGVRWCRKHIIEFIKQHMDDEKDYLTLSELIAEIEHWESKDTQYSMRNFVSGEEEKLSDLTFELRMNHLHKELKDLGQIIKNIEASVKDV